MVVGSDASSAARRKRSCTNTHAPVPAARSTMRRPAARTSAASTSVTGRPTTRARSSARKGPPHRGRHQQGSLVGREGGQPLLEQVAGAGRQRSGGEGDRVVGQQPAQLHDEEGVPGGEAPDLGGELGGPAGPDVDAEDRRDPGLVQAVELDAIGAATETAEP